MTIDQLLAEVNSFAPASAAEVESFRIRFLGRKGLLKDLAAALKDVAPEDRKSYGMQLNELKQAIQFKIDGFQEGASPGSGPSKDK
jgi:phenylalanyl-tRNA synthetase alpha chain